MDNPRETTQNRDYRLDLLKAIAIILVVLRHFNDLLISPSTVSPDAIEIVIVLINSILQLTFLGVPLFFIVSLYLFLEKTGRLGYFKKRVKRLTALFVFWSVIQFAVYFALRIMAHMDLLELKFEDQSPIDLVIFGGPSLPIVGGSVFYYLFNLLWLTVLAYVYSLLNNKFKIIVSSFIIGGSLFYFELCFLSGITISYRALYNYILYIPLAYALRNHQRISEFKYYYLVGFILFSVQDIACVTTSWGVSYDIKLNAYGRISVVLGVMTILSFVSTLHLSNLSRYIQFLSFNILGIFALHKYWLLFYLLLLHYIFSFVGVSETNLNYNLATLMSCIFTVISTLLSVYLLGNTRARKYLT